jgi:hypothetical protein
MIKMRKAVVTDSLSFVLFCFAALSGVEGRINWGGGLRLRSDGQSFDFVWSDKGLSQSCHFDGGEIFVSNSVTRI